jgi:hypothetical protein
MAIVPVRKRPGVYYNTESGKFFSLVEYRDGDKFDTVTQAAGAITAGTELDFFADLTNKKTNSTNLKTPRRISKGEEMLIKRIGFDVPLAFGNTLPTLLDIKKVIYNGMVTFKINNKLVAEQPAYTLPSGYGLAGSTTENNTTIVSNGVPSTAAQRQLEKVHEITSEHDLDAKVRFDDYVWITSGTTASLDGRIVMRFFVGGLIREAATK